MHIPTTGWVFLALGGSHFTGLTNGTTGNLNHQRQGIDKWWLRHGFPADLLHFTHPPICLSIAVRSVLALLLIADSTPMLGRPQRHQSHHAAGCYPTLSAARRDLREHISVGLLRYRHRFRFQSSEGPKPRGSTQRYTAPWNYSP